MQSPIWDLSGEDRLRLTRLSEQVELIAERLGVGAVSFRGAPAERAHHERLARTPRPPLPDPRLIRKIIRQRQLRARYLDGELFADPAWDILLDLIAARAEHVRVSVTSLCMASGVPPSTALRWINRMTDDGLLERVDDEVDRRRAFVALTDRAAEAMARYFAEMRRSADEII